MKPLLIYDGNCTFCRKWIARWQGYTKDRVDYEPYQKVAKQFPQISQSEFESSVQLIENGKVYRGAEAVFRSLAYAPRKKCFLWLYRFLPGFAPATEWFYNIVAARRKFFSKLTGFLWGDYLEPPTYYFPRWLFLRFLGIAYLVAFTSLWPQLLGLVGSHGILPVHSFLKAVHEQIGLEGIPLLPSVFWANASDTFLQLLCGSGIVLSILLVLGVAQIAVLFFLWCSYLSLLTICRDFLSFQWDILLLETGLLAIFLAPRQFLARIFAQSPPSSIMIWLLRWLLFRLMWSSALVKLLSGDATWRNLTALNFHYETQPLPTWISWYAHQLPEWFHKISVLGMFIVEGIIPFLIFMPRRLRFFACISFVFLQLLIIATGNYGFFNLLTIVLCILLLDDGVFPQKWRKKMVHHNMKIRRWILAPVACLVLILSSMQMLGLLGFRIPWSSPLLKLYKLSAPFHLTNNYGLFAIMTTSRPEIIVEGSQDGETWLAYEFKYKPGDLKKPPMFVAPHQPRLDWQMWFAALNRYEATPWFQNFLMRLLQGEPAVLSLLEKNPFPQGPPKFVRAMIYEYHFTDIPTRQENDLWWRRDQGKLFSPVLSLRQK